MQLKAQYIQLKEQLEKRLYSANDPDNILNTKIEGLHLSPRTYHVLDINEIETLGDIAYSKRNKFEVTRYRSKEHERARRLTCSERTALENDS